MKPICKRAELENAVRKCVERQPVYDIHTHLYTPAFGSLLLWGIDELLTYHYLIAEVTRYNSIPYDQLLRLPKKAQAELIWDELFVRHSPISEATRGVLTCLDRLGISTRRRDLEAVRAAFRGRKAAEYIDTVFETANVEAVVMTNNPFDAEERPAWDKNLRLDSRFKTALRIDELLVKWPQAAAALKPMGYAVEPKLSARTLGEVRRFLHDWIDRMKPAYFAASLPPSFDFPEQSACARLIEEALLPVGRERALPFAMMIGVKKLINPALALAGDGVGRSKIEAVEHLCAAFPDNKFLVTMLARENQHELCVAARKFRNLMPFGCWWFLNNPSLIEEMTRMRLELLGTSFIPQHSDARVLDQLIYKWAHSREILARTLADKYWMSVQSGWPVTKADIRRDVANLLGGNFKRFVGAAE